MTRIAYDGTKYLYMFTLPEGRSLFGEFRYHPPTAGGPGQWMPEKLNYGDHTVSGYFGIPEHNLPDWTGPELWLIETADSWRQSVEDDLLASTSARLAARVGGWDRAAMIRFACDAAERLLSPFETINPKDKRPHQALAAVRALVNKPGQPGPLRDAALAAGDAAKEARIASRNEGCLKKGCEAMYPDAARVARIISELADAVLSGDPNDYRSFVVRPSSPEERAWQIKKKLSYCRL